jgi:hypothetical protein
LKTGGFEWIPSNELHPYVSIDRERRLYISKPARKLLNLPDDQSFYLAVGYNPSAHRIALARPFTSADMPAPFRFDKRSYARAKHFVERARLEAYLPARFLYIGPGEENEGPPGSHIFELATDVSFEA